MSEINYKRICLPSTFFGEDRNLAVKVSDDDVLMHVWRGDIDQNLTDGALGVNGFRFSQSDAVVALAAMHGYCRRIKAGGRIQDKIHLQTDAVVQQSQYNIDNVRWRLLTEIASGSYSDTRRDNPERSQEVLAPCIAGAIGLYLARATFSPAVDSFVMLRYKLASRHNDKDPLWARAQFASEDLPIVAGAICEFTQPKYQYEISNL